MSTTSVSVFVIMPFTHSPTRDEAALTHFFEHNIRAPLEARDFDGVRCTVTRSGDRFDINREIILALYSADFVICDLSGEYPNANVMYELGVRLAVSNGPVVLIREDHLGNHNIFDTGGFHTFAYDPLQYHQLELFLVDKIGRYISGDDTYTSPVLDTLAQHPSVVDKLARYESINRLVAAGVALHSLRRIVMARVKLFALEGDPHIEFGDDVSQFSTDFNRQTDRLRGLNWESLDLGLASHPALEALMISPPSVRHVPPQFLSLFQTYVLEFWTIFFATNAFTRSHSMDLVVLFLSEAARLQDAVNWTAEFLKGRVGVGFLKKLAEEVIMTSDIMGLSGQADADLDTMPDGDSR